MSVAGCFWDTVRFAEVGPVISARRDQEVFEPVPLTPDEQDALRQIEGHLTADDPTLVAYLAGRVRCRRPGIRLLTLYLAAPLLIGVGLVGHLIPATVAGLLLAPATPALSRWVLHRPARASRRRPAPTPAESVPTTPTTWPPITAPGCWFGMWWWWW